MISVLLAACRSDAPGGRAPPQERDTATTATGSSGSTADTGGLGATSTGDTGPPPPFDCDALPPRGTIVAEYDWPGFEDFTFGDDGYLWGVSSETYALTRIPRGGPPEILRPGVSTYARGTRFLLDGDLVSVDYPNNTLLRIDRTTYGSTVLSANLTIPNGVAIGLDGYVYLSQGDGNVRRIDPVTGDAPVLVTSPVSNDGITFSPDFATLYLNSDATTDFLAVGVGPGGTLTSPLATVATLPSYSDGMVVDACGNVYVTQFYPRSIVRVRTDGTVEPFVLLPPSSVIVALNFGSGLGGWVPDHLYLSDLLHGMLEVEAGVYGKPEPHLPSAVRRR